MFSSYAHFGFHIEKHIVDLFISIISMAASIIDSNLEEHPQS